MLGTFFRKQYLNRPTVKYTHNQKLLFFLKLSYCLVYFTTFFFNFLKNNVSTPQHKIMSERPSRGPRPYYGPVAGSEDDSNNGNDSIDESEFETQLSIGSQSIDLLESDEIVGGTGVNEVIELLSSPDENEGEDEIVGEDTKTQVRQSLVLLLLLFFFL